MQPTVKTLTQHLDLLLRTFYVFVPNRNFMVIGRLFCWFTAKTVSHWWILQAHCIVFSCSICTTFGLLL